MGIDGLMVKEIVKHILCVASPDKIILFNLAATGKMTRERDIDLAQFNDDFALPRSRRASSRPS